MTSAEALDIMFGHVQSLTPEALIVVWPDKPDTIPVGEKWIRPIVRTAYSRQTSLSNSNGIRKFTRTGVLSIDCYAPVGDGNVEVNNLANIYQVGLEKLQSSPIWYRNIRSIENGKEGSSSRVSVMADFEYDAHN